MEAIYTQRTTYEKPTVVDYGSLVELTASNGVTDLEDGLGKLINTDGSNPIP
jgi:hypothetical protein